MTTLPLWWRIPTWIAITVATVIAAPGVTNRIVAGVTLGIAACALQFAHHPRLAVRRATVLVTTVGGLVACLASHDGLAEIAVFVVASRIPEAFDGLVLRWFVVLDTMAVAAVIGYISASYAGALAGAGIPLLVLRAQEHRDLVRERDRAQALLAEVQAGREAETQAAALRERGRIAREMHDVLAHSLAGLSVQLQAVRALATREGVGPDVLDPLDKAAELARAGLGEARAAVGALRAPVGLGLAELPALVRRHPGETTFDETGTPGEVTAEAGHAIYRAVQESLTNAARYAPGSPVAVALRWSADGLTVTVTDSGPGPDREPMTGVGTGLGLAGMTERLEQAGGRLTAGPRPAGGWQVELTVPAKVSEEVRR